jgi:alpha 1,3-glucosidase
MRNDPYTLTVALAKDGSAKGELYVDEGDDYSHEKGEVVWRGFEATSKKHEVILTNEDLAAKNPSSTVSGTDLATYSPNNSFAKSISTVRIEKIVLLGVGKPKSVVVEQEGGKEENLEWNFVDGMKNSGKKEGGASVLTIRGKKSALALAKGWRVIIKT